VSVDVPEPPELRVTVEGLSEVVSPEGETAAESVTVPENPLKLARLIVDVPDDPA
jgi:hypothetical protein